MLFTKYQNLLEVPIICAYTGQHVQELDECSPWGIYIYIYIYIYIHTHTYIYIYIYIHNIHTYTSIHTYIYIYTHTLVYTHTVNHHLGRSPWGPTPTRRPRPLRWGLSSYIIYVKLWIVKFDFIHYSNEMYRIYIYIYIYTYYDSMIHTYAPFVAARRAVGGGDYYQLVLLS